MSRRSPPRGLGQNGGDPLALAADVVVGHGLPRLAVWRGQPRRLAHARPYGFDAVGIGQHAGAWSHELGRAADRGREHRALRRHRLEKHLPERLYEARQAEHVAGRYPVRDPLVGYRPDHLDAPALSEARTLLYVRAQGPVAHQGEPSAADALERAHQPDDVLAVVQGADEEEERPLAVPPEPAASLALVAAAEALEVDPAVDHLDAADELGQPSLELAAQEVGDRHHRARPLHRERGGEPHAGYRADVAHVGAVGGQHKRRAGRLRSERRERAGGHQEVGVDDLGAKTPRLSQGLDAQRRVFGLQPAAVVDDRPLELVSPALELRLDLSNEAAQVGVVGAGVHLRDEQHAHGQEAIFPPAPAGRAPHRKESPCLWDAARPMAAANEARAARLKALPPALDSFGRAARGPLAVGALLGTVGLGVVAAVGAATAPSSFVPFSRPGAPDWLQGPLAGLVPSLPRSHFAVVLLLMCAAYLAVLALADALRARWALGAVVVLHLAFLLAPPLFSGDVFGYLIFGRLGGLHGLDPYTHGPGAAPGDPALAFAIWPDMRSPYGPLFTLASYAVAPLGIPAALWTYKALAAIASLGCVALVAACAHRLGRPPLRPALFVGLNPVLLVYAVGGAHNDLLMALLVTAGLYLAIGGRERLGAAALAGACAVKVPAGVVLAFLLAARRGRGALAGALAAFAALGAASVAAFGARGALGFFEALELQQQLVAGHSVPGELVWRLGLGGVSPGLRLAAGVALGLVLGALLVRTWRGGDWIAAAGWATLALLVASAWLRPWYVAWVLPLAALAGGWRLPLAALVLTAFLVWQRMPLLLG